MSLPTPYQQFIHMSRYSRWRDDLGRREMWDETVERYCDYMADHIKEKHGFDIVQSGDYEKVYDYIYKLKVMPSMRALMTAGPALARDAVCGYNCAYLEIDDPRAFDEVLVILMSGTGVGFSVESRCVDKLPIVSEHFEKSSTVIVVEDSKSGWGRALRELISLLYAGQIPAWDLSKLRPAGARLKVMGGRSSGPEPLNDLFKFCVQTFQNAKGRRLTTLECHDLVCKIASIVVVGGVRRSALISLSDLSDTRLQTAKSGQWYVTHPYRALANNSAIHSDNMPMDLFMDEWKALYQSGSGERGIFSRDAAVTLMENNPYRDPNHQWGTNPCAEIILRPMEFCNLTSVSVRPEDTLDELAEKVRVASMLGTWQSTLTHFKYLRKRWKDNCEEERLLGVSLNGVFNNELAYKNTEALEYLRSQARLENAKWAATLNIPVSASITCVKPEGTTSQLNNVPSGIHPAYAPFYIRRVRQDNKDPLTQFLKDSGIPYESCVMNPKDVTVFSFPIASGCSVNKISALEHLEVWKTNQLHWSEHKPSVTVTVRSDEWLDVAAWVWKNRSIMSGVSFLPDPTEGGVVYQQMPYEEITEAEYEKLNAAMPKTLDWSKLSEYEKYDTTTSAREFACVGNTCEIVGTDA